MRNHTNCVPLPSVKRIQRLLDASRDLVDNASQFQDGQFVGLTTHIEELERAVKLNLPSEEISPEAERDWCEKCGKFNFSMAKRR